MGSRSTLEKPRGAALMVMAALWEDGPDGGNFALMSCEPNAVVRRVIDRMPVYKIRKTTAMATMSWPKDAESVGDAYKKELANAEAFAKKLCKRNCKQSYHSG